MLIQGARYVHASHLRWPQRSACCSFLCRWSRRPSCVLPEGRLTGAPGARIRVVRKRDGDRDEDALRAAAGSCALQRPCRCEALACLARLQGLWTALWDAAKLGVGVDRGWGGVEHDQPIITRFAIHRRLPEKSGLPRRHTYTPSSLIHHPGYNSTCAPDPS